MNKKKEIIGGTLAQILLLTGFVLLLIGLVIVLTRPAFHPIFDFSETGGIGDTIGGITAPLINTLGAILVYLSFRTQIKANEIQKEALKAEIESNRNLNNFNVALSLFKDISNDFYQLEFDNNSGRAALKAFTDNIKNIVAQDVFTQGFAIQYSSIVRSMVLTMKKIKDSEMEDSDRRLITEIVLNFYVMNITGVDKDLFKSLVDNQTRFMKRSFKLERDDSEKHSSEIQSLRYVSDLIDLFKANLADFQKEINSIQEILKDN